MELLTGILILISVGLVTPNPITETHQLLSEELPTKFDETQMRADCENGVIDSFDCFKLKIMNFFETLFQTDNYKISDDIEIRSNGPRIAEEEQMTSETRRSTTSDFYTQLQNYIQNHDVNVQLPFLGSVVNLSPRNINNNELNLNLKFTNAVNDGRGKSSKLKKIAIPIMVFVLLKAMTLIPLALGVLGLKAFNALQLGFLSFIVSVGLALFQLCKKLANDNHHHPHIAAHGPWDSRSLFSDSEPDLQAQNLAYNAYLTHNS